MSSDKKIFEIKLVVEVGTYGEVDPEKLIKAWLDDQIPNLSEPWYKETLWGTVEVKRRKIE